MKTTKHPKDLTEAEAAAIVADFDNTSDEDYSVTDAATLAEGRIEAAALAAHRSGLSWGVIGAQLGMTRQGARQRFERLVHQCGCSSEVTSAGGLRAS